MYGEQRHSHVLKNEIDDLHTKYDMSLGGGHWKGEQDLWTSPNLNHPLRGSPRAMWIDEDSNKRFENEHFPKENPFNSKLEPTLSEQSPPTESHLSETSGSPVHSTTSSPPTTNSKATSTVQDGKINLTTTESNREANTTDVSPDVFQLWLQYGHNISIGVMEPLPLLVQESIPKSVPRENLTEPETDTTSIEMAIPVAVETEKSATSDPHPDNSYDYEAEGITKAQEMDLTERQAATPKETFSSTTTSTAKPTTVLPTENVPEERDHDHVASGESPNESTAELPEGDPMETGEDGERRGINACPTKEEVIAPYWANNTRGETLALLNVYPFEQYVHLERCEVEMEQMYCREGCRCEQQFRLHRLLAFDPKNDCRGIFADWFRFPSSCLCICYDLIGGPVMREKPSAEETEQDSPQHYEGGEFMARALHSGKTSLAGKWVRSGFKNRSRKPKL